MKCYYNMPNLQHALNSIFVFQTSLTLLLVDDARLFHQNMKLKIYTKLSPHRKRNVSVNR